MKLEGAARGQGRIEHPKSEMSMRTAEVAQEVAVRKSELELEEKSKALL